MEGNSGMRREIWRQVLLWVGIMAAAHLVFTLVGYTIFKMSPTEWYGKSGAPWLLMMATAAPFMGIIHYYWLYESYLRKKNYARYLLMLPLFFALATALNLCVHLPAILSYSGKVAISLLATNALQSFLIMDIPFILFYTTLRAAAAMTKRRKELEQEQTRTGLLLLKNQLEPHFIFNALNTAYAIALREQAQKTLSGIEGLAAVLRYATETALQDQVSIDKELRFVTQYTYLTTLCAGSNTVQRSPHEISWDRAPANITPMLLLPFLQHSQGGTIDVSQGVLQLNFAALHLAELDDVRKRLDKEYNGCYSLTIEPGQLMSLLVDLTKTDNQ